MHIEFTAANANAMEALGVRLAPALRAGMMLHLHGELGAGKTTLIRGILRGLGHTGAVKSPTYTLVEPYPMNGLSVFHFDLYRLKDPEELEFLGIRDYLEGQGICLVEWAERGAGVLPAADVEITIHRSGDGRQVQFLTHTASGDELLRAIS
jgi:tRNA threonylcarbamoyladenosine biosynthesis protein TsaE